jgi:DNA-binding transcriptional LysR family regulator
MQFADQTGAKEIFDSWFPGIPQQDLLVMRTNVSSANYWAVLKGAGIGLLPTYASSLGSKIVPLETDLRRSFDIWLSYHPDSNRIPRVRRMIDWIVESFSPVKFPWFRDEFIHPNDLKDVYKGEPLIKQFEGFSS